MFHSKVRMMRVILTVKERKYLLWNNSSRLDFGSCSNV